METLVELATQRLHTQGGRMTTQRRMILEALDCLGCHPTAEEIFAVVCQRDATAQPFHRLPYPALAGARRPGQHPAF